MKINVAGLQADIDGFVGLAESGLAGTPAVSAEKARVMFAHHVTLLGWFESESDTEQAQIEEAKRIVRELLDWANTIARQDPL